MDRRIALFLAMVLGFGFGILVMPRGYSAEECIATGEKVAKDVINQHFDPTFGTVPPTEAK